MILEVAVHGFDRRGALLVDLLGLTGLHPIAPGCDCFTVLALSLAGVALLAWFHRRCKHANVILGQRIDRLSLGEATVDQVVRRLVVGSSLEDDWVTREGDDVREVVVGGRVVVEAGRLSGALITARVAGEDQGREVMAVPGRIDSPASRGCLEAIRDGWAAPVLDHADVLRQLDGAGHLVRGALAKAGIGASAESTVLDAVLTAGQKAIVEALRDGQEQLTPDQLAARTGLPLSELMADLTLLEITGRARRTSNGVELKGTAASTGRHD